MRGGLYTGDVKYRFLLNQMQFEAKIFSNLSNIELFEIYRLRAEVFVVEQNCAYQDVDEKDLKSHHVLLKGQNQLLAYCRILPPGLAYKEAAIGRVVVPLKERKKGYAKELMRWSIAFCKENFPTQDLVISAQTYLIKFYSDLNFVIEGPAYLEDNIPHQGMRLKHVGK